ncbi:MAG TPA: transcriptional regulator [Betaproteobacteria bacterium]|nr:transcriptional regulator [Betaproteobacteria bacterium]
MLHEQAFFNVLSDETRRRLLALILREGELCVCELFYALEASQPKVSRHLAVMREAGLLSVRREGTWVFYRLDARLPQWAADILGLMAQGGARVPLFQRDAQRLAVMPERPMTCCR